VTSGWAHPVAAERATVRARAPRVRALDSVELAREGPAAAARIPAPAWRAVRDALPRGPVLVQVARAGYLPVVACGRCRTPARCGACHGPLGLARADGVPTCGWCGRLATAWRCSECGHERLRSVRVGSERTAEELGRAFPGTTVRVSGARAAGGVLDTVPDRPALVVATPGAEPVAAGGYAAAVILDAGLATAGSALGASVEGLRRWLGAAALVRSADEGGQVLLVGDAEVRAAQALVRWDPAGLAVRELEERTQLSLPPAVRIAAVTGPRDAVQAVVGRLELPSAQVLGPVVVPGTGEPGAFEPDVRALVRVPRADGAALARAVAASAAVRSARREGGSVRIQLDPQEIA
jgi:primosomal protein N' (replication factor Y)